MAEYRRALDIEPDTIDARYRMAVLLASQGQAEEAIRHLQRVLELQPGHAEAHNMLGAVLEGRDDLTRQRRIIGGRYSFGRIMFGRAATWAGC